VRHIAANEEDIPRLDRVSLRFSEMNAASIQNDGQFVEVVVV
jgi:hypothetical protein